MNFVGTVAYRFPNPIEYPDHFKLWLLLMNCELRNISPAEVYDKRLVCSLHFADDCFIPGQGLKHNAIPTLNMPPGINYLFTN